jgi:hypothetical protein
MGFHHTGAAAHHDPNHEDIRIVSARRDGHMKIFAPTDILDEVGAILDPLEGGVESDKAASRTTATRPASLDGQTLAVIDNRTSPRFRQRLVERLKAQFAFDDIILVIKDTVNVPPRPEDWQEVIKRGTVGLALYGA